MAVSDTLIGSVFDGRYRIERKLGAGGMADVYLAEDLELGRRVAIKILNDRHAADDSFIERFRREAKNAAGLSHPNIVSIYDRGEAEGTYYIAMEFLDGRSLKELIVGRGPAPIKTAIDYARQILAAVGFAHKHGIVHRDIKPHNVLVGPEGRLKVTDFGIARSGASQMTEVGSIIGTAQYLSPEQARGAPVDQTSDLYSVGVVLYEMLTGQVPFTGDTPLEIAMKHLSEVPKPPSELRPEVPHDLDSVVLRALAKDPSERYQSAEEMDADLARVAEGLPVDPETETMATAVLSGSGLMAAAPTSVITRPAGTAPTRAAPPGRTPPAGYYGYEGPPRRRRRGRPSAPAGPRLARGARRAAAAGRGRGRVVRLHEDSGPARPEQAGGGAAREGHHRAAGGAEDSGRRAQPGRCPRLQRCGAEGDRDRPEPAGRRPRPEAHERPDHRLEGQGDGEGAERDRPVARCGDHHAGQCRPGSARLRRQLDQGGGDRHRAGPACGPGGREGQQGPDQRLQRAGRRDRAVGGRHDLRPGEQDAAEPGVPGLARGRRQRGGQGHGGRPEPERQRGARLDDPAQRLEGPEAVDRPGRDEPGRGLCALDARERRLQGRRPAPGRERPGPRRDRAQPEPEPGHAGAAELARPDRGRPAGRGRAATTAGDAVSGRVRVA